MTGDRKATWRDVLPIHPAAAAYPRLSADELAELAADIKARGLQMNVVLFREGGNSSKDQLLDGISRLDALEANGINLVDHCGKFDRTLGLGGGFRVRVVADVDPVAMAASLNVHRRQLSAEDKRKHIETLLKANPEKSDRQLDKVAKVHNETVAAVRKQVEGRDGNPSRREAHRHQGAQATGAQGHHQTLRDEGLRRPRPWVAVRHHRGPGA